MSNHSGKRDLDTFEFEVEEVEDEQLEDKEKIGAAILKGKGSLASEDSSAGQTQILTPDPDEFQKKPEKKKRVTVVASPRKTEIMDRFIDSEPHKHEEKGHVWEIEELRPHPKRSRDTQIIRRDAVQLDEITEESEVSSADDVPTKPKPPPLNEHEDAIFSEIEFFASEDSIPEVDTSQTSPESIPFLDQVSPSNIFGNQDSFVEPSALEHEADIRESSTFESPDKKLTLLLRQASHTIREMGEKMVPTKEAVEELEHGLVRKYLARSSHWSFQDLGNKTVVAQHKEGHKKDAIVFREGKLDLMDQALQTIAQFESKPLGQIFVEINLLSQSD